MTRSRGPTRAGGWAVAARLACDGNELAVGYSAEPMEIGFNARYLVEIAAQLKGTEAEFRLADAGSPTLIRDKDGADALYVLMPMRV